MVQDLSSEKLKELEGDLHQALPEWVRSVRFTWSLDLDGEPVLLAFLTVDPDESAVRDGRKLWEARQIVAQTYANKAVPLWPHVRFESPEG